MGICHTYCRYTNLKGPSPLRQQVLDTSPQHHQCWFQRTLKTPQKRPRQLYKTRLGTAMDWHPILMNGTFEVRHSIPQCGPKRFYETLITISTTVYKMEMQQREEMRASQQKQATSILRI